ncbi:hypothetical protein HETIRDRAFT_422602 [Heterobasidion irregulare TC 32-1]|uniref:Uncharacterized protein n=1 Tax=Heterobasidion irregulare (strain TC 32-1) TaxID=747525 RepID=W4JR17_HETIT|nr:uncharacterized protein HETIRDRAFT_422602 [Heterobasidion irregulare TC 32-1]ETW75988.1 hypothetical protein HETIRDRAFT_422602 [Heterobasidion irregulare TC 32-1]
MVHFAMQQQAVEAQALEEEAEQVATAEHEAEEAEVARAASALEVAEKDHQREMFSELLDVKKGNHQMAALKAESILPLSLFLHSPSPSVPAMSFSCPKPSFAHLPSQPNPLVAESNLASTTTTLHCISIDPVTLVTLTNMNGKPLAAAVVVEFAHQQTPSFGCVMLPLGPGYGQMSTVWASEEWNGASKVLKNPPGLVFGDCLSMLVQFLDHGVLLLHLAWLGVLYQVCQLAKGVQFPAWVDTNR